MPLSTSKLSDKKITPNFTRVEPTSKKKKSSQTNKDPSKLTLNDVANTLKTSYDKNNNAKKAPNPYLDLMFQNLSSATKPKKVVDDKIFKLLKFARIVNVWVRRNMPLAPCNKEVVHKFGKFELPLAAADYIFTKCEIPTPKTDTIKKIGGGTCRQFSELALDAILSHGNLDNISASLAQITDKNGMAHIFAILKYNDDDDSAVVVDAHSENAEPCLLIDIKDKLNSLGYNDWILQKHKLNKDFNSLDNIEFQPSIIDKHKKDKTHISSLSKNTGEEVLYKDKKIEKIMDIKITVDHSNHQPYLCLDSTKYPINIQIGNPEDIIVNLTCDNKSLPIRLGILTHTKEKNLSKFIFLETQERSGSFRNFPNLFADIPFNYINSKGQSIPTGEDIMNI